MFGQMLSKILLLFFFCKISMAAPPSLKKSSTPSWVQPFSMEAAISEAAPPNQDSIRYLFRENQVQYGQKSLESYFHWAYLVTNEQAVQEASDLSIEFDPSFQELTFHFVRVWRSGKPVERLDLSKFNLIQPESNLDIQMFDGLQVAHFWIEDVQVGDGIEVAYTLKGKDPVFKDSFMASFKLQWGIPIQKVRYRLLWPAEKPLYIKSHKTKLEPTIQRLGKVDEYMWALDNVNALLEDGDLPAWYTPWPWIQLSTFKTWQEVVEWGVAMYPHPKRDTPEFGLQLQELQKFADEPEKQALSALDFVQNEIRYVGIESGIGSHQPRSPESVLKKRYGDCKDKAYLLVSLLIALDIEAAPVLVHTELSQSVADLWPTPWAFNHVIVWIKLKGMEYWVDPTRLHEKGRLYARETPPYRKALILKPKNKSLTTMPEPNAYLSSRDVLETFILRDFDQPALFAVRTELSGRAAKNFRQERALTRQETMEKNYLNFYSTMYPEIEAKAPLQIEDNPEEDKVVISETYAAPHFWVQENHRWKAQFIPLELDRYLAEPQASRRTMPLAIPFPLYIRWTTHVQLPEDWPIKNSSEKIESPALSFKRRIEGKGSKFSIHYELVSKRDHVLPEELKEYAATVESIKDLLGYQVSSAVSLPAELQGQRNWLAIIVICFSLVFSCFAAWKLYRMPVKPRDIDFAALYPRLVGFRGWLAYLGLNMIVNPFIMLVGMLEFIPFLSLELWAAINNPLMENYHPFLPVLVLAEIFVSTAFFVFSVLLLVLYFQKKQIFPRICIVFFICNLVFLLAESVLIEQFEWLAEEIDTNEKNRDFKQMFSMFCWSIYLALSKRVHATFTRNPGQSKTLNSLTERQDS